ncbi:MAG: nucleotidyltransferase domain-containing protein [Arachnia sp.]
MSAPSVADHPRSLDELRRFAPKILDIVARHKGTDRVLVFGSVARGEAGPNSDVDLLIEFHPDASLFDLSALELELERLLSCPVDVMSLRSTGRAADHARAQAVPLA